MKLNPAKIKVSGYINSYNGNTGHYVTSDANIEIKCLNGKTVYLSEVFEELIKGQQYSVSIYSSNCPLSLEKAKEKLIKKYCGEIEEDWCSIGWSETTCEDYIDGYMIGGHNICNELKSLNGKFVIIIIKEKLQ